MKTIEVRTQRELDAALDSAKAYDTIAVVGGSWLEVSRPPKSPSATVRAYDTATVTASGSATVRAYDTATVTAYGSATVTASDTATVRAYGTATVTAYGSATVTASGSATVRAYGTATVRAYGTATVRAYDTATVTASKFVPVHRLDPSASVTGGILIDVPACVTPESWADYHGCDVSGGLVTLYKAVDADWQTPYSRSASISYIPGTTAEAPDFRSDGICGGGLHACASPHEALGYHESATRLVEVRAPLASLSVIDRTKVKAPRLECVREVDVTGRPVHHGGFRPVPSDGTAA